MQAPCAYREAGVETHHTRVHGRNQHMALSCPPRASPGLGLPAAARRPSCGPATGGCRPPGCPATGACGAPGVSFKVGMEIGRVRGWVRGAFKRASSIHGKQPAGVCEANACPADAVAPSRVRKQGGAKQGAQLPPQLHTPRCPGGRGSTPGRTQSPPWPGSCCRCGGASRRLPGVAKAPRYFNTLSAVTDASGACAWV